MAVPGTFISGTGPIGRGSAEKRAGNLNFAGGATIEIAVWGRVWAIIGGQVLPGGDQVLPGCDQVVTRCCQVVTRCDQMLPDGAKTVRKVFLKKGECQEKCFGVVGVARKVFLGRPAKIKGQTLLTILPPSAAIKSEQRFWT